MAGDFFGWIMDMLRDGGACLGPSLLALSGCQLPVGEVGVDCPEQKEWVGLDGMGWDGTETGERQRQRDCPHQVVAWANHVAVFRAPLCCYSIIVLRALVAPVMAKSHPGQCPPKAPQTTWFCAAWGTLTKVRPRWKNGVLYLRVGVAKMAFAFAGARLSDLHRLTGPN